MSKKTLEKVVGKDVKPIVDEAMHKFLGVSIDELSKDISEKLERSPLLDFDIDTGLPFKKAKKNFKRQYLKKLLEVNYGNISEAAKLAQIDRRSIHRMVKDSEIDVRKIRLDMVKAYEIKQSTVASIIEDVLDDYKNVIHPVKLTEVYRNVPSVSKDILESIPEKTLTLKEAEEEFEKEYLRKALQENGSSITKTAEKVKVRYETLHRKLKKVGLI